MKRVEGVFDVYIGDTSIKSSPLDKLGCGWRTVIVYDKGRKWCKVIDPYTFSKCKAHISEIRHMRPMTEPGTIPTIRKRLLEKSGTFRRCGLSFHEGLIKSLIDDMKGVQ